MKLVKPFIYFLMTSLDYKLDQAVLDGTALLGQAIDGCALSLSRCQTRYVLLLDGYF